MMNTQRAFTSLICIALILSGAAPAVLAHDPPKSDIQLGVDLFDSVSGLPSTKFTLKSGELFTRINPVRPDGTFGFAREVVGDSTNWQFNTNNRFSFWIKAPLNAAALKTDGTHNFTFGSHVKRVQNADPTSHTAGGFHAHHELNIPPTGTWTKVILNMHPSQIESQNTHIDPGNQSHPTGEPSYNYFDALTQFYLNAKAPSNTPAIYLLDQSQFSAETNTEEDDRISSLAGTYVPEDNRIIVTWNRDKTSTKDRHYVKYAFEDIHAIGWNAALQAPNWRVNPEKQNQDNGMIYDTTNLNLSGRDKIYIAIKPENSVRFSQIEILLGVDGSPSGNQAPSVYAGSDLTIFQNNTAKLNGNVADDGLPNPPGVVTITWEQTGGPGTVIFTDSSDPKTTATFSFPGVYSLRLKGKDGTSQQGGKTANSTVTVTVLEADTTPPVISNIQVAAVSQTTAQMLWTTNEPVTTEVEYGISAAYGNKRTAESVQEVFYSTTIQALQPATLYHFRINATDGAGNTTRSTDTTFTTEATPNNAPTIDTFSHTAVDRDTQQAGLQVYAGDTITFSASASDPDNQTLYWAWFKSLNGGAGTLQSIGTAPIANLVRTIPVEESASHVSFVLHVTDGVDLAKKNVAMDVLSRPTLCVNIRLPNREQLNLPHNIDAVRIRVQNASNDVIILDTIQSSDAEGNILMNDVELLSAIASDNTTPYTISAKPESYIQLV